MDVVKCPACRMTVAVSNDGTCPSCGVQLSESPASSRPAAGRTIRKPAKAVPPIPWEQLAREITDGLRRGRLPRQCGVCGAEASKLREVAVDHQDFQQVLPICLCARCVGQPPYALPSDRRFWVFVIALFLILGLLTKEQFGYALTATLLASLICLWLRPPQPMDADEESDNLRNHLSTVPIYRRLLDAFPDMRFSTQPATQEVDYDAEALANRAAASAHTRRGFSLLSPQDEWLASAVPSVVLEAWFEIVDEALLEFARTTPAAAGFGVQVSFAALPGRRKSFEIQGLPDELAAALSQRLMTVPVWPVAQPLLFLVQRHFCGVLRGEQRPLEEPFISWWRALSEPQGLTMAEVALQFHRIETSDEPPPVALEDIEAFRARLPASAGLAILQANYLQFQGRHDEALAIYDELIKDYPEEVYFRQLRSSCLEAAGMLERAAAECQAILAAVPNDANTCGYLAHLQLMMSRPEDAIETASRALAMEDQPQIFLVRAQAKFALQQFDQALADANIALFADANTAGAYLLRARLRLHHSNFSGALADLDQLQRLAGLSQESVYLKAVALRGHGQPEQAIQLFNDLLAQSPEQPLLTVMRADFLAESGKLELALSDCDALITRHPEFAPAYLTRAAIRLEQAEFEPALQDAEQAIALGLENARAFMLRALAKEAVGDTEDAVADLSHATTLDPQDAYMFMHRARMHTKLEDFDAALLDYSTAINLQPDNGEALVQRGYLQLRNEQFDAALADFEAALRVAPTMADAYRGRAVVRDQRGSPADALTDLNQALVHDPDNVACRLMRANLLLSDSERHGAKSDLDNALQLAPDFVPALFQRAHLHLSLGDHAAARRDFDAVLKFAPDSVSAFIGRSVAWEQSGNLERSAEDVQEATRAAPMDAEQVELSRLLLNAATASSNEQFDKAISYANQAIELSVDNLDAYRIRGGAYWYTEQLVEALEDYTYLIQHLPELERGGCYNARGQVNAELAEFERAHDDLNRAVAMARDKGAAVDLAYSLNGLGRALTGMGRFAEAEQAFTESLELRPDNAWLHYNRGLMFLAQEKQVQAATCFELSLQVANPKLSPRKRARAQGFLQKMAQAPPE